MFGILPGLLTYGSLADLTLFEGRGRLRALPFGRVDLVITGIFMTLFVLLAIAGFEASVPDAAKPGVVDPVKMIVGTFLSAGVFLVLVGGILASLTARQISWRECFFPSRIGLAAVMGRAAVLLIVGLPLVMGAIVLSRVLLAASGYLDDSPQDIVSFLEHNRSRVAQWVVAIFAVVVAPMQEEFLFRGYSVRCHAPVCGPGVWHCRQRGPLRSNPRTFAQFRWTFRARRLPDAGLRMERLDFRADDHARAVQLAFRGRNVRRRFDRLVDARAASTKSYGVRIVTHW